MDGTEVVGHAAYTGTEAFGNGIIKVADTSANVATDVYNDPKGAANGALATTTKGLIEIGQ